MAKKTSSASDVSAFDSAGLTVLPTELHEEVEESFLEYAYSVIHSRALPDARDGLKPVHRRILFGMAQAGLRPDHAHVKCARIVGDVMGRYHPHGDSAIYEALVRLGQPFATTTPVVDPHGNFGSPNDPAAAMRYTEARLSAIAMAMVGELGEDTVDMVDNYDGSLTEPSVLPAEFPYLLVNGSTGIAVGMATKMAPHNLGEVIALTRAVLADPDVTLKRAMKMVPGPDFPTGGLVLGMDGIEDAYRDGKGTIRIRARASIGALDGSRGRQAITVTELPYEIGTEKVIESIKSEIAKKRLDGISDVKDLSDRNHGTRLVIECKTGINPEVLLAELYRLTPLEVTFGIANLALVDGRPQTLGLLDLVRVFISHRRETVTRRTQYRLSKAESRLHIVEGLLIALNAIDAVVKIIKASATTSDARAALMKRFKLSDIQAGHILDMPLRRLVALEVQSLTDEGKQLRETISELSRILADPEVLNAVLDEELRVIAEEHSSPRRSTLVSGDLAEVIAASAPTAELAAADEPCTVLLSTTGRVAYQTSSRTGDTESTKSRKGKPGKHSGLAASVNTTTHGHVLLIDESGVAHRIRVLDLPALTAGTESLASGAPVSEYITGSDRVIGIVPATLPETATGVFLATRGGVVKVCQADWPTRSDTFDVISLKGGDKVVSVGVAEPGNVIALVTSEAQLLHFAADGVRAQGRSGGGVAGIKLGSGATVVTGYCGPLGTDVMVFTYSGTSMKVTPLSEYPGKGRATGGVRAHRFLKGENTLVAAHVGIGGGPVSSQGVPVTPPAVDRRRDGSGTPVAGVSGFSTSLFDSHS